MKHVLIDTNIILDIALKRPPYYDDAARLFTLIDKQVIAGYVTASSVTDIYYITKKEKGHAVALAFISDLIEVMSVISIDRDVIARALRSNMKDFEDAIQVSAAVFSELDCVITRNTKDFANAPLEVLDPVRFLKMHE